MTRRLRYLGKFTSAGPNALQRLFRRRSLRTGSVTRKPTAPYTIGARCVICFIALQWLTLAPIRPAIVQLRRTPGVRLNEGDASVTIPST